MKYYIINVGTKILIVVVLFMINLRFMIPNGETMAMTSNVSVLFVIDKSVSMSALDYNGNKERWEGVVNDCSHIVDELSGCKFSMITVGDDAKKVIPFITDSDMVQAEVKSIITEDDYYAKGTSLNISKDIIVKTLEAEKKRQNNDTKFVLFFISDGEITKEGESLTNFSSIKPYLSNGAVLGYGTTTGGKMVSNLYKDQPNSEFYYVYYYNDQFQKTDAVSKIDEGNLKKLSGDMGIDYINMNKTSNIDYKIKEIKQLIASSQTNEEKITSYQDTYYYFAIPLVILLGINFIIQKKRIS